MRSVFLTLFDSIRRAPISARILLFTEIIFFVAPILFFVYLVLISWQTHLDILEPIKQSPVYALYFIMFLSFFFCGFVTRFIRKESKINKENPLLKVELLLLTGSQLLVLNLFCAALLVWYIQREYGQSIFKIKLKNQSITFKNLPFIISCYIFLVAILIFILRLVLKTQ